MTISEGHGGVYQAKQGIAFKGVGMSQSKYFAKDEQYQNELNRLRLHETEWDPISFRRFETIGIRQGWNCLEVGAGTGSVAEWLSKKVGPSGRVTATDIDPRFMQDLKVPNLEVRQHDILKDSLETNRYDLVHCRMVLEHLQEPDKAFQRMVEAALPGGVIFVEDQDVGSAFWNDATDPAAASFYAFLQAGIDAALRNRHWDNYFGRRLFTLAGQAGLTEINGDGIVEISHGGDAGTRGHMQTVEVSGRSRVSSGAITQEQLDALISFMTERVNDPNYTSLGATLLAVWGRKPTG